MSTHLRHRSRRPGPRSARERPAAHCAGSHPARPRSGPDPEPQAAGRLAADALRGCAERASHRCLLASGRGRFSPSTRRRAGRRKDHRRARRLRTCADAAERASAGVKWASCRRAPGDVHYVVCNADEGEPGTFKDRVLLQGYADLVFAGMTVAGRASARAWASLPARRVSLSGSRARAHARTPARAVPARRRDRGRARFRLRHRDPPRRRRVRLRRGIGADRVDGGKAGSPAQPPAVSCHARIPGPADDRQQRRDVRLCGEDRRARRRIVRTHGTTESTGTKLFGLR